MHLHDKWNYNTYHPLNIESDEPEILSICPQKDRISFQWHYQDYKECTVFYKEKDGELLSLTCDKDNAFFIGKEEKEYEFFISVANKKSITRLVRCGQYIGSVVNYLHPIDNAYDFSGKFLGSPSIARLPSGHIIASMDVFGLKGGQNLTKIFKSFDDGNSWQYVTDLFPCFWGTLFVHNNILYMFSISKEYGDVLLGQSLDEGITWQEPIVLSRGSNFGSIGGFHKAPVPIIEYNGNLCIAIEYGCWAEKAFYQSVFSIDKNANLMDKTKWKFSGINTYNKNLAINNCSIEGNIVEVGGRLKIILRHDKNIAKVMTVDDLNAPPVFEKFISFPYGHTKFYIQKYKDSYYAVGNLYPGRNILSVAVSYDCEHWQVLDRILDYSKFSEKEVGMQYPSFFIENDTMYLLVRTAFNGADDFHNSNCITFHKVKMVN